MHSARPYEVVAFWDPAIDIDRSNIKRYTNDYDIQHLKFKEGQEPVRYVCRPVKNRQALGPLQLPETDALRYDAAFRCAVTQVKRGNETLWRSSKDLADLGKAECIWSMTEEEAEAYHPKTIETIGCAIWTRTFLPPELYSDESALPLSLLQLAARMPALVAAWNRVELAEASGPQPAPQSETSNSEDDLSGTATVDPMEALQAAG